MKRLVTAAVIVVALTGCSLMETSRFDPNEYSGFIGVLTRAETYGPKVCDSEPPAVTHQALRVLNAMDAELQYLHNYATYRQRDNEDTAAIVQIIRDTVREMIGRYSTGETPSKFYCNAKFGVIVEQAKLGATAVQEKARK